MKKFMKALAVVTLGWAMTNVADAQIVYPYVVDFEAASTPTKAYASTTPITINNVDWIMPGVYIGNPQSGNPSPDFYNGSRAGRMRLTSNTTGDPSYMEMQTNLPQGADSFTFWTGMYGTETGGRLLVQYSIDNGNTWVALGDTIDVTGTNTAGQYVGLQANIQVPVRFRINRLNTNDVRVNIDDIRVTAGAPASNLVLTGFTPSGTVHPSTNTLTLTFNEDVVLGTGNITLFEVSGSDVVYDVTSSPDVAVANNVVTVSNVSLQANAAYYVQYDSAAIEGAVSGLKAPGIYDNTSWTFATSASSLQNFDENFDNCSGTVLGIFVAHSVEGSQQWFCDTYNDTTSNFVPPYVTINGGSSAASFGNEDYLVTSIPIDLSALDVEKVTLFYAEKRRFGGNGVTRGIYYSADYAGDAATATWVAIDDNLEAISPTGTFIRRNKDITANFDVTQPVYLAFLYASVENPDTSVNWSWSLDDISLEVQENDGTSINPLKGNDVHMSVLGIATTHEINVRLAATENMNARVTVYDVNGRSLFTQPVAISAGTQVLTINNVNLNTGMYVIKLDTARGAKVVKFMAE